MQDDSDHEASPLVRLYFERKAQLTRFFAARSGSSTEAEDLMQELYLKIRTAPPTEILNGPAYLYQLCLRLYQDRYRTKKRREKRDDDYVQAERVGSASPDISDAPSPEDAVEWRLRLEQVMAAVETLPPQCRRVFRLHKLEGMDHQTVARTLGISRSSVEKHMISALRHLTRKLNSP
ncbi:MAG: sigma-70 family RNA polymerase sigma factor [Alphaproteobacteria bacterium]